MGRRQLLNLWWSLAVLSAVAVLGVGLPRLNASLPAARPVRTGVPYQVGAGVSVIPPAGASVDVTKTAPGSSRGSALFVLGGVRYLLVVVPYAGTLEQATGDLRRKITSNRGYQVTGQESETRTGAGVAGRLGGYTSPGREGRYAVFLNGGLCVEVTLAGGALGNSGALPALTASVASIRFPGGER